MKNKFSLFYAFMMVFLAVKASAISGPSSICPLATATFTTTLTCTSGTCWSSSDTTIASINAGTGVATGKTAGTTTITFNNGSDPYETFELTVNPGPTKVPTFNDLSSLPGRGRVCVGTGMNVNFFPTNGDWTTPSLGTFSGRSGSNITYTGVTEGIETITYTIGSCSVSAQVTVGISEPYTPVTHLCTGATTNLHCITGKYWTSSTQSVATIDSFSGHLTGISAGTTRITFTYAPGCYKTEVISIGVPEPITGTDSGCVARTIDLDCATTGGTWSSSNTARATIDASTGVVTGVTYGGVTMTYTAAAGCYTTRNLYIFPTPGVTPTGNAKVCVDYDITLNANCTGGYGAVQPCYMATWSSSNTSVATVGTTGVLTAIVTPVDTGIATITITNGYGCSITKTYTVNAHPVITTVETEMCSGSDQTMIGYPASDSAHWVSDTPSTVYMSVYNTGYAQALGAGVAHIKYYIDDNYCTGKATITVSSCEKAGNTTNGVISITDEHPGYKIVPNPGDGNFRIIQNQITEEKRNIKVTNYLGAVVHSGTATFTNGVYELSLKEKSLSPGMYLISLTNDKQNGEVYKLIIK